MPLAPSGAELVRSESSPPRPHSTCPRGYRLHHPHVVTYTCPVDAMHANKDTQKLLRGENHETYRRYQKKSTFRAKPTKHIFSDVCKVESSLSDKHAVLKPVSFGNGLALCRCHSSIGKIEDSQMVPSASSTAYPSHTQDCLSFVTQASPSPRPLRPQASASHRRCQCVKSVTETTGPTDPSTRIIHERGRVEMDKS